MARMIAARISAGRMYMAFMKKNKVACVMDAPVNGYESQIFMANEKSGISITHGFGMAMTIPDDKCITRIINLKKVQDAEKLSVRTEFSELIDKSEIADYLYDYQFLPPGRQGERVICVAVKKSVVEEMKNEAKRAGSALEYAVPESIAIGNLIKRFNNPGGSIFVDIGIKNTVVRVYRSFECIAMYVIENGIESIVDTLENAGVYLFDRLSNTHREIYRSRSVLSSIDKLLSDIIRTVDYYDENGISNRNMNIFFSGEGVFIPELVSALKKTSGHKCESISRLLDGEISVREAALLASAIGATF